MVAWWVPVHPDSVLVWSSRLSWPDLNIFVLSVIQQRSLLQSHVAHSQSCKHGPQPAKQKESDPSVFYKPWSALLVSFKPPVWLFFGGFSPVGNPFFFQKYETWVFLVFLGFFYGHILNFFFPLKGPQIQYRVPIGTRPYIELSQCFYLYIIV